MSCTGPGVLVGRIRVTRGASRTLVFTVRADAVTGEMIATVSGVDQPSGGVLVDLTGAKVWFTVKNRVEDAGALMSKRSMAAGGVDNQVLVVSPQTGATAGQFLVRIDPADTALFDPGASYWCDVWVQLPGGPPINRQQVRGNGQFVVEPAVTITF